MNSHIEKYKPEYKDALLSVWERSVLATHHFLEKKDFLEIREMLYGFDFETLDVFCLIEGRQVIGFIGLHHTKIEMLFLDPDHIGKGFGLKVVNFAIAEFYANHVDVNEQNTAAVKFYRKLGFETFERTEKDDLGKDYPLLRMKADRFKH